MPHSVFISYARKTSLRQAHALYQALDGEQGAAFLDVMGVEVGERIPRRLIDALLNARVVVIFADDAYFASWYCRWEFRAALAPLTVLTRSASPDEEEAALAPIIIVRSSQEGPAFDMSPLPPLLRETEWPGAEDVEVLAQLVRSRLELVPTRLCERIDSAGGASNQLRARLLEEAMLTPPVSLAGSVPLYPLQLPPSLGSAFVGRAEELWRIHDTLGALRGGTGAASNGCALEGGSGFGKTRLALEYLHRFGMRHYPGGIFWVNGDVSDDRLEEQLHGILQALLPGMVPELTVFRQEGRVVTRELEWALHEACERGPVLCVVDNLPETLPGQSPRPLETWCPAVGKVALLVTSKARLLGMEGVYSIVVEAMAPAAAVSLLTDGIRVEGFDEAGLRRVVEWVGALPLALELLNRALRAKALGPAELLQKAWSGGAIRELDRQAEALQRFLPARMLRGVSEALQISYERLTPSEQRVARLMAQFSPEPIPLEVFEALVPSQEQGPVRSLLESRHFVLPVTGDVPLLGSMHSLLAEFLLSRAADPHAELQEGGSALLKVVVPERRRNPQDRPLMNACLPHAERIFELMSSSASGRTYLAIQLGFQLESLLHERGLATRAVQVGRAVLRLSQQILGRDHWDTVVMMVNLATSLDDLAQFEEAQQLQEEALHVARSIAGDEHGFTLKIQGHLAATLSARGRLPEARALEEQLIETHRRLLGDSDPALIDLWNNLAKTLFVLGELEKAREHLEKALALSRELYGEEHPTTLQVMNSLAVTLSALGALPAAQALHERSLELSRRLLGEEHPTTLVAMNTLASTLIDRGELEAGRRLQERVLEARRRILGEAHPSTLVTKANLSLTLERLGDFQRARELLEEVVEVRRHIFGDEHHETLTVRSNLAKLLLRMGEAQTALLTQGEVLRGSRRVFGKEHPQTLHYFLLLALMMLVVPGWQARAWALIQGILETFRRARGAEHPFTINAALSFIINLRAMGESQAAQAVISWYLLAFLGKDPEALPPEQRKLWQTVDQFLRTGSLDPAE